MKLESTIYSNFELVIDEFDIPVAVRIDGKDKFKLYDDVQVTPDSHGYICPGIRNAGSGRIVEIQRNLADHFFGILMENGEFGYAKNDRIQKL